jgi:amino acid permease
MSARHWVDFLYQRPRLTFVLAGGFFMLFGITSVNLFVLLQKNIELFLEWGWSVVEDGAAQQFVELVASAYLSLAFYVMFKACERILVERWTAKRLRQIRSATERSASGS